MSLSHSSGSRSVFCAVLALTGAGIGLDDLQNEAWAQGKSAALGRNVLKSWVLKEMAKADVQFCWRDSYSRGAGYPWKFGDRAGDLEEAEKRCKNDNVTCKQGGLVWYPTCKPGYFDDGAVLCWGNCPSTQSSGCGGGCAANGYQCASKVTSMVMAPIEVAGFIVSTVLTAGGAAAAKSAAQTAIKAAAAGAKALSKEAAKAAIKFAAKEVTKKVAQKIARQVQQRLLKKYAKDVADSVIEKAAESLALSGLAQDDPEIKSLLQDLDPTGVAQLVDAFNNPICGVDEDPPDIEVPDLYLPIRPGRPTAGNLTWFPTSGKRKEDLLRGVFAGQDGSRDSYVCRAKDPVAGWVPGRVFDNQTDDATCYYAVGTREAGSRDFQLLVGQAAWMRFDPSKGGGTVESWGPIVGGVENGTNRRWFVCRAEHENSVYVGKAHDQVCEIAGGGSVYPKSQFEVLARRLSREVTLPPEPPVLPDEEVQKIWAREEEANRAQRERVRAFLETTIFYRPRMRAVVWGNGKAYFFKGSQYVRYDIAADRADPGFPQQVAAGWPGLWTDGIDAAVNWSNGKAYFFKGSQYIRYDIAQDRVDPGFPQQVAAGWPGLWTDGIDAAVNWGNGKAYFFKGGQYIRYDIAASRVDPGFPQQIAAGWPGLWTDGVDAAVNWGNGKAYFFKGGQYIRYDIAQDRVDAGSAPIAGSWRGLTFP